MSKAVEEHQIRLPHSPFPLYNPILHSILPERLITWRWLLRQLGDKSRGRNLSPKQFKALLCQMGQAGRQKVNLEGHN